MKTARQIVLETIEAYPSNKERALEGGSCKYLTRDGKMCAVGRCLLHPTQIMGGSASCFFPNTTIEPIEKESVELYLKPEYRGHPIGLWADLQIFHDYNGNFTEDGLTVNGKMMVKALLEKYN